MVKVRSYACYNRTEVKIKSTVVVFLFTKLKLKDTERESLGLLFQGVIQCNP
jgi:hypothetical protein